MANEEFWKFVEENSGADAARLRLKYHNVTDVAFDVELAITQIECRRKFGKKLRDTMARDPRFLFPSVLAGEQSTSDLLASYHASLVTVGTHVADLTCGLGIDAIHLADVACSVDAIDIDEAKVQALQYNARHLQLDNLKVKHADCREYISSIEPKTYDIIFIDPARRGEQGQRLFSLADCKPDVVELLPQIRRISHLLIVKMSPMLDISHTAALLPGIRRIISLGTPTECKELVAVVSCDNGNRTDGYEIEAVTLRPDGTATTFSFTNAEEQAASESVQYGEPVADGYLYEPYPSVMKAAPYRLLAVRYGLHKLHGNTHIYYSDTRVEDFPGEVMQVERVIPYASKNIKRLKRDYPTINVVARNFDISADSLRNKLGVKDGGDRRLYALTTAKSKLMIIVKSEKG